MVKTWHTYNYAVTDDGDSDYGKISLYHVIKYLINGQHLG